MIDFIDKTSEQNGTPINRENMMAMQGFVANTTTSNADGSVTKTNSKGDVLTIGVWQMLDRLTRNIVFQGEKTITLQQTMDANGNILEVLL